MNQNDALRLPYSWWVHAVFALIVGFGTAQDSARRLSDSYGWTLVGRWALIGAGVLVFVFSAWVAIEKFRARDLIR